MQYKQKNVEYEQYNKKFTLSPAEMQYEKFQIELRSDMKNMLIAIIIRKDTLSHEFFLLSIIRIPRAVQK